MTSFKTLARGIAAAFGIALAAGVAQAQTQTTVGTTFPDGFMAGMDASTVGTELLKPWIGFGGEGPVTRTPVIILHGNDGTPYPISGCGRFSMDVQGFAQYLVDMGGYAPSEVWALGWQGDQCDQTTFGFDKSASDAHTITANVPDLRAFVAAVMRHTGASKVDFVAHGTGAVLVREWVRQDASRKLVRRFVSIDGTNNGMAICSNHAENSWATPFSGGFTPDSPLCQELGSPDTPFLKLLNKANDGRRINLSDTMVIRNGDSSFLFFPRLDGVSVSGAPGINERSNSIYDSYGTPTDFTTSASVPRNSNEVVLTGQHGTDVSSGTAHVGIANSETAWQAALSFLGKK